MHFSSSPVLSSSVHLHTFSRLLILLTSILPSSLLAAHLLILLPSILPPSTYTPSPIFSSSLPPFFLPPSLLAAHLLILLPSILLPSTYTPSLPSSHPPSLLSSSVHLHTFSRLLILLASFLLPSTYTPSPVFSSSFLPFFLPPSLPPVFSSSFPPFFLRPPTHLLSRLLILLPSILPSSLLV
ncbi:hypothetical protein Pcinc_041463 [Petrolisthes cinctipes]|uniref:Uncharacterized protein n=1 Tax=Petrolisthes cinctipes TaxID=88211 RepID=A0AAE1BN50_PETCI|nr:hypothetical protein Pcinc_041463 [Petrolisthes cinctipes]